MYFFVRGGMTRNQCEQVWTERKIINISWCNRFKYFEWLRQLLSLKKTINSGIKVKIYLL